MSQNDKLIIEDGRDLPIFIHSELDDMGLKSRTFRVYAHLARRAGRGPAWPSYNSMGEICFRPDMPTAKPDTLRRLAIEAVKELVDLGLISKEVRRDEHGEATTNVYRLTPSTEWKKTQGSAYAPRSDDDIQACNIPQGSAYAPRSAYAPKGTPIEDTPTKKNTSRAECHNSQGSVIELPDADSMLANARSLAVARKSQPIAINARPASQQRTAQLPAPSTDSSSGRFLNEVGGSPCAGEVADEVAVGVLDMLTDEEPPVDDLPVIVEEKSVPHVGKGSATAKRGRKKDAPNPGTNPILNAYADAVGYEIEWGMEGKAAKKLADRGYTPDQVVAFYHANKRKPFWNEQHLSLASIAKNLPAWLQAQEKGGVPLRGFEVVDTENGILANGRQNLRQSKFEERYQEEMKDKKGTITEDEAKVFLASLLGDVGAPRPKQQAH